MIIEISVGVIAIAFVILVIYLVITLIAVKKTLHHVNQTIVYARKQVDELGVDTKKVMSQTYLIGVNVQNKMEELKSLFKALGILGDYYLSKSAQLESVAPLTPVDTGAPEFDKHLPHPDRIKFEEVLEIIGLGIRLWQKLKKRR